MWRPLLVALAGSAVLGGQPGSARANVDLVTMPARDAVQLTIYNSADLTLVRDQRALTLSKGSNKLQFSWAETLIDPTSLELVPKANGDQITVAALQYPPRTQNLGRWLISSGVAGKSPFEITYFTSGISWRATYMATLAADEQTMRLQGYVRVTNGSGEDYENAQTRVVVGRVHLLDQIAALAQQRYPYGSPVAVPMSRMVGNKAAPAPVVLALDEDRKENLALAKHALQAPKEIVQEGLSEYFVYTIAGTETIANGWSKRLPTFDTAAIPVVNLYKYEEERYGKQPVRFLYFKNDAAHQLGKTPIPDGSLAVYRGVDAAQHLSYEGRSDFKYIPVNQEAELNLGPVANVIVEPKVMAFRSEQFTFDNRGNINGWDEVRDWQLTVKNTRDVPVRVAITRNLGTPYWTLKPTAGFDGQYEQVDATTVKFTLTLAPRTTQVFGYALTTRLGRRQEIK